MDALDNIITYLNCISRLLAIIESFPLRFNQFYALENFLKIEQQSQRKFDSFWRLGKKNFLLCIKDEIVRLETSTNQDKYIIAYNFCINMDRKITYANDTNPEKISLRPLLPVSTNRPLVRNNPLNSNYSQTTIEIHPKFDVYNVWEETKSEDEMRERNLSNRDAFTGINECLVNLGYTKYSQNFSIVDVVVDCPESFNGDCLTIGFSPITDQNVLQIINKNVCQDGFSFDVASASIKESKLEFLEKRFENLWLRASESKVDIVFFPELLGLSSLERVENSYHTYIKKVFEKAVESGFIPPKLTFLPSVCRDDSNSISAVYQDGQALGTQHKRYPYVDKSSHRMEAIKSIEKQTVMIIHIPGVHRIALMICSDYLTCSLSMQEKLFADLGVTLLLVPSYSKGEQDFINKLSEFKKYGTTVVWGNCCGATKPKRIIGGCSVAALDEIHRFDDCSECGGKCKKGCLFLIKIPMHIKRGIREKVNIDTVITQVLL